MITNKQQISTPKRRRGRTIPVHVHAYPHGNVMGQKKSWNNHAQKYAVQPWI